MVSRISLKNDDGKSDVEEARPRVLDDDMVWSISNYLNPVDNIHFRAVCKTFRSIIPLLNPRGSFPAKCLRATNLSPWLVLSKNNEAVYSFINPMHNNENYLMSIPELLKGSTIRSSKGGWLLMSKGYYTVFFYNPFTKETIKLPDLPESAGVYWSFSSLPTSSDCVVFAISDCMVELVCITLIKRGDEEWKNNIFDNVHLSPNRTNMRFQPSFNSPIFYNGACYCLDVNGTLGVFTLENGAQC
ncbi:F-box protein At3g56470-like [Papaver somniferum]|uniref:F-box protein At3g56470-like n=1 Tax=Papaver somniferum TaxID=3469 RepID=UPI000E6FEAD5|nr:F-box protein At3g56470-like [Papaver somniferum]